MSSAVEYDTGRESGVGMAPLHVVRSRRYFEALHEHGADVVIVVDPASGRIRDVLGDSTALLGHGRHELIGESLLSFLHQDDRAVALQGWEQVHSGTAHAAEFRVRGLDGGHRWVETTSTNLAHDPDVSGIVVNVRDVSGLKRTEQRLQALLRNSGEVIVLLDENFEMTYVTPSVERLFGTGVGDVGSNFFDRVHPDDQAVVVEALGGLMEYPGATASVVIRSTSNGGASYEWVEAFGENMLDDRDVGALIVNFRIVTARVEAEQELRRSESHFRSLAESAPLGVFATTAEGSFSFANEKLHQVLGTTDLDELGLQVADFRSDPQAFAATDLADGIDLDNTYRIHGFDGRPRYLRVHANVLDGGGIVGLTEDVTETVSARRERSRLIELVEATSDAVFISDDQLQALYVNRAARQLTGLEEPVAGSDLLDWLSPSSRRLVTEVIVPSMVDEGSWSGELEIVSVDGSIAPMSALLYRHVNEDEEFVSGVLRDMSERQAFDRELEHQATHDPLTGLPNRALLGHRIELALQRAGNGSRQMAVLFLDIDRFKILNDSVGHAGADQVLVAIGDRLRDLVAGGNSVARFGGDEFVVLMEDLADPEEARRLAERIRATFAKPIDVDGQPVQVRCSIGVACGVGTELDGEELLRNADTAMYRAKNRGRDRIEVFDERMEAQARRGAEVELELGFAIERNQLRSYYQPIIELHSGRITAVEALLRWDHPTAGLLGPGEFIGVAEDSGLIIPIGEWVIVDSCRQVQWWRENVVGCENLQLSVNLSPRQFNHVGLTAAIVTALRESGLPPAALTLELTENLLLEDFPGIQGVFEELQSLGLQLVIDDFGTGYSALSYLRRFPIDGIKIDREFIAGLGIYADDTTLVSAIVTMARELGLNTVAEGVERPEHIASLRALGCDRAQGFLISRPAPAGSLTSLLAARPSW